MHIEKLNGKFWVIDNKTLKKLAGPYELRDTALGEMRKLAAEHKRHYWI